MIKYMGVLLYKTLQTQSIGYNLSVCHLLYLEEQWKID